jgi:hypothetical protein
MRLAPALALATSALLLHRLAFAEPAPPTAGFPAPATDPGASDVAEPGKAEPVPATAAPSAEPVSPATPAPSAAVSAATPEPAPPPLPAAPVFPREEPSPRNISLTISPLRLLVPMFEASLEVRLGSFGVALLGGAGQVAIDGGELDGERLAAYELGGIVTFYPLESFENLSLGAELLWLKVNADDIGEDQIRGFASGIALGPLIGYKTIGETGFTFAIQGGVAYVVMHAEASNAYYEEDEEDDRTLIPLVNLNLGWSF